MQHFNFIRMAVGIIKDCDFNKHRRKKCHPERQRRVSEIVVEILRFAQNDIV